MEKFAGYGFNKSHSAAYALLSYQTAWLKTHYPAAFMSAVLSSDMDKTDKVVTLIDEARRMQLKVEPPDVNSSHYMFTVSGERAIRYGLGAIKGVGQSVVEMLATEREAHGAFPDLAELCRRSDQNRMNRRVLEALIRSGALDLIGANRATLMHALPAAMQLADQTIRARVVGQDDMFGLMDHAGAAPTVTLSNEVLPDWSRRVRLDGERDTLGLYLTGIRSRSSSTRCGRSSAAASRTSPAIARRRAATTKGASSSFAASRPRSPAWCSISASAAAA
jgi:DNA polymerase-3 subunit alpha